MKFIKRILSKGGFSIYRNETGPFNFFEIGFNLPVISTCSHDYFICECEDDKVFSLSLDFNTSFSMTKDFAHWFYSFRILGLGVWIIRQWSY